MAAVGTKPHGLPAAKAFALQHRQPLDAVRPSGGKARD